MISYINKTKYLFMNTVQYVFQIDLIIFDQSGEAAGANVPVLGQ